MRFRVPQPCRCGSGESDYALNDAAGIFCGYVCEACEEKVRGRYKPQIFDGSHPYASTGEEADIDLDYADEDS